MTQVIDSFKYQSYWLMMDLHNVTQCEEKKQYCRLAEGVSVRRARSQGRQRDRLFAHWSGKDAGGGGFDAQVR